MSERGKKERVCAGMSENKPRGERERERERLKRERFMAGFRGVKTLGSNKDSQQQPVLHYTASMDGDTLDLLAALWDFFQF